MGIRSIVFDFDGTLIDSNRLKYEAYFELFTDQGHQAQIIREVLSENFEQTRYVILEKIVRRLGIKDHTYMKSRVSKLAEQYNDIVVAGAKTCPEKIGAEKTLKKLAAIYRLYVSSTTPESSLKEIIRFRKWDGYFCGVFGYPHKKTETLLRIMALEKLRSDEVLVVGDGESDRESAVKNACPFVHVTEGFNLEQIDQILVTYTKNDTLLRVGKVSN
ncbi:MAG: HAD hydrolase-like protein [Thermodesulfobacteriota bacterium]|jgi:phosphoglycolate phosphatase-like HAD superfamily hydrolase|nr:MAG: HAD hydrolase-like protein [Thermodesulfobacteriota bacterium]